ncbi:MAG: hypothetical protein NTW21_31200 [Verrucomicrobia bacterium]|nr:hypothetical protein [Verrucomicrobiota bacterium]
MLIEPANLVSLALIVVIHDHRTLDVFDRILDVEDGMIQSRSP